MGYQWLENPAPALAFDLFIFKPEAACIVRVRQTRYGSTRTRIYEKLIPDESPRGPCPAVPSMVPERRSGLRTRHERVWRRLCVLPTVVSEIEWSGPDITRTRTPGRCLFLPDIPPL